MLYCSHHGYRYKWLMIAPKHLTYTISKVLGIVGITAGTFFLMGMMYPLFGGYSARILEFAAGSALIVGVIVFPVSIVTFFLRFKSHTEGSILWLVGATCGSGWVTWAFYHMVSDS